VSYHSESQVRRRGRFRTSGAKPSGLSWLGLASRRTSSRASHRIRFSTQDQFCEFSEGCGILQRIAIEVGETLTLIKVRLFAAMNRFLPYDGETEMERREITSIDSGMVIGTYF
jgi:hypothetical protein